MKECWEGEKVVWYGCDPKERMRGERGAVECVLLEGEEKMVERMIVTKGLMLA